MHTNRVHWIGRDATNGPIVQPCRGYYFADTDLWAPGTNYDTIDGYGTSIQSSGHVYFIGRSKTKQQTTATTPTGITLVNLPVALAASTTLTVNEVYVKTCTTIGCSVTGAVS